MRRGVGVGGTFSFVEAGDDGLGVGQGAHVDAGHGLSPAPVEAAAGHAPLSAAAAMV